MFQFSCKGISVGRAVPSRPRNLFAYGWRATFDSRGDRWVLRTSCISCACCRLFGSWWCCSHFWPAQGQVVGCRCYLCGLSCWLSAWWHCSQRWTAPDVCNIRTGPPLGQMVVLHLRFGTFSVCFRAQRWLVADGGRRRVFALLCCGVSDTHYALFCRDMGQVDVCGGQLRRTVAVVWGGGGEERVRNYKLWGRSFGSVSGRPV